MDRGHIEDEKTTVTCGIIAYPYQYSMDTGAVWGLKSGKNRDNGWNKG